MSRLQETRIGIDIKTGEPIDLGPIPSRVRTLDAVDMLKECTQRDVVNFTKLSPATVSRHLKALRRKGFVRITGRAWSETLVYVPDTPDLMDKLAKSFDRTRESS